MKETIKEIPIQLFCTEIINPRPWKYQGVMAVFGRTRFVTYGDTVKDIEKTALRRLKSLLLKSEMPD